MIRSLPQRLLIMLIRFYQVALSPLKGQGSCRFHPTCSHYALEAVSLHGALRGSYLAFRRVLKCHPFHPGGSDPVPMPAGHMSPSATHSDEAQLTKRPAMPVSIGPQTEEC